MRAIPAMKFARTPILIRITATAGLMLDTATPKSREKIIANLCKNNAESLAISVEFFYL